MPTNPIPPFSRGVADFATDFLRLHRYFNPNAPTLDPAEVQRAAEMYGSLGTPGARIMHSVGYGAPLGAGFGGAAGMSGLMAELGAASAGATLAEGARQSGGGQLSQILAEMAGNIAPGVAASKLGLAVIPAFHGTPHRWDVNPRLGRVGTDVSRMGSGEGVQAFGWGHYSAESPGVAKSYAEMLTDPNAFKVDGTFVEPATPGQIDVMTRAAEGEIDDWLEGAIHDFNKLPHGPTKAILGDDIEFAKSLRGKRVEYQPPEGQMYGLLHDVNPEDLLDLDVPLSQQSPKVREALEGLGIDLDAVDFDVDSVADELELVANNDYEIYQRLDEVEPLLAAYRSDPKNPQVRRKIKRLFKSVDKTVDDFDSYLDFAEDSRRMNIAEIVRKLQADAGMESPEALSKALHEAGIPGSMFYDGMSRAAGEGTRNYIMFTDELTYVDPARTDKRLWDQLPIGEPFRTVE